MASDRTGSCPDRQAGSGVPACGFVFDGAECAEVGEHYCRLRAEHVQAFFTEILVHTKGVWGRRRFTLAAWQYAEIIAPVFGNVAWSAEFDRYVRTKRVVWIELARKQGKSEILAGIALYLLVADGEESAEIYGAAGDREQARKVFDVAERMITLSPVLSRRLRSYKQAKRIVDERTGSYYEIIPADAQGNLGHNPHGIVFDEVLTQKSGDLWDSLRTAMGTRAQPLLVAATTPGNDPDSWCGRMHNEMARIADDPARAPHVHVLLRNTPAGADPFDESGWSHANPALGDFLSIESLRQEALEARLDPAKENAFRQFRLAQWVAQATRWMPMHTYDASSGEPWPTPDIGRDQLAGRTAWVGFDLAAKFDLTAWALLVPDPDGGADVLWRFWLPEAALFELDRHLSGQAARWAGQGWLTVTDGDVLDYQRVYADIARDAADFHIAGGDADQWSSFPVLQEVAQRTSLQVDQTLAVYTNTFARMSPGLHELMALVKQHQFRHHGNPVARWCFSNVEVRRAAYDPELIRPDKPQRGATGTRIDAVPAASMAVHAWTTRGTEKPRVSAYDNSGLLIV